MSDSTVVLFRASREEGGRDLFSCSALEWRLLHEIAITFGWNPLGTTYPLPARSKITVLARHNYEAGTPSDIKHVDRSDAADWARALEAARRSDHLHAMLKARSGTDAEDHSYDPGALATLIDEFVQYAHGGAFSFSVAETSAEDRS